MGFVVSCLAFSTLSHTSRLMPGGTISDNKYNSSTLVGLRHPVIARHALLSSESSLKACADFAHTGAAYSATEYLSGNAVVLIVLALVPHLELDSFLRRLLRVATLIFELWKCWL